MITRNEFMTLAQGLLPESIISKNTTQLKVAAGQKLLIDKPAKEPPPEVLTKLTDYLKQIAELQGAYFYTK